MDEGARQGTLELIKIKLLLQGSEDSPLAIRLEMSSEADLFFHYIHASDVERFAAVQKEQKLMVEFSDYPSVLIKMLNLCIVEPHIHLGILTLSDQVARLDFIQNMEYKFIELLHCMCVRSPDIIVQASITNRYNAMKQKMMTMQNRLQEIHSLIKIKNPSLLLQLQKVATGPGGSLSVGAGINMGSSGNSNNVMSPPASVMQGGGNGNGSQYSQQQQLPTPPNSGGAGGGGNSKGVKYVTSYSNTR